MLTGFWIRLCNNPEKSLFSWQSFPLGLQSIKANETIILDVFPNNDNLARDFPSNIFAVVRRNAVKIVKNAVFLWSVLQIVRSSIFIKYLQV